MLRVLKLYYKVSQFSSSSSPDTPRTKVVLQIFQLLRYSAYSSCTTKSPVLGFQLHRLLRALKLHYKVDTHDLRRGLRRTGANLHFVPSTRAISAEGCSGPGQVALPPAFRALDTRDLSRGLRRTKPNRTLACISRIRHARSPQRAAPDKTKSHTLVCISRIRHARSPQRVARDKTKPHSRLHFAHSARTISAEGCAGQNQIALLPAFRASDTRDLRRGLLRTGTNRTLTCISRIRHARSPQRVAPDKTKSHSRLHFAHPTRTISAEDAQSINRRLNLCKIQSNFCFFNRIYAFEIQLKLVLKFNRFCPSFLLVCVISKFLACMRSSLGLSSPQVQL